MRIRKHAARKAGVVHPTVASAQLFQSMTAEERKLLLPGISVKVEGKARAVKVKVMGLRGFEGPDLKAEYHYWVEMTIQELAMVVSETMKAAPSAELFEAVTAAASAALPRRSKRLA
jgi:hypothetical protein